MFYYRAFARQFYSTDLLAKKNKPLTEFAIAIGGRGDRKAKNLASREHNNSTSKRLTQSSGVDLLPRSNICVGITGSYASGKTYLLNCLANLGFRTFSADEDIRELYQKPEIQNMVLALLPKLKVFDRKRIAEIIYNDDSARKILQDFIHPFVVENLSLFQQDNNEPAITFAEVPLLFEAGFDQYFNFYVTTFCSETIRLERAKSREGFNLETYNKIAEIQLSQKIKMAKADFIINTEVNRINLDKQILQLINKLKCYN